MNFIFYYSIPLFFGIMPAEYFENLLCLTISLEKLYSKKITKSSLNLAEKLFKMFLIDVETLYGDHIMTSSIHELINLVQMTIQNGPLNITNCYPYEELNRKLTRMINGRDLIGDEFLLVSIISMSLERHTYVKVSFTKLLTIASFLRKCKALLLMDF